MHVIAAKAVCFVRMPKPEFKTYSARSSRIPGPRRRMKARGYQIVAGARHHLFMVDLRGNLPELTAKKAQETLDLANITATRTPCRSRPAARSRPRASASDARRDHARLAEKEMEEIAACIDGVLKASARPPKRRPREHEPRVVALTGRFPCRINSEWDADVPRPHPERRDPAPISPSDLSKFDLRVRSSFSGNHVRTRLVPLLPRRKCSCGWDGTGRCLRGSRSQPRRWDDRLSLPGGSPVDRRFDDAAMILSGMGPCRSSRPRAANYRGLLRLVQRRGVSHHRRSPPRANHASHAAQVSPRSGREVARPLTPPAMRLHILRQFALDCLTPQW